MTKRGAHPIVHDRLEKIKSKSYSIMGSIDVVDDLLWLINEVERLRDGSEYWGMNQELTEQIDTLREALEPLAYEDCESYCSLQHSMDNGHACAPAAARKALTTTKGDT